MKRSMELFTIRQTTKYICFSVKNISSKDSERIANKTNVLDFILKDVSLS